MRLSKFGIFWGCLFTILGLILGDSFYSALGLGLAVGVFFDFIKKMGTSFPLLELIFFISVSQLILGPYFSYRLPTPYFRYTMYVPEADYMALAVPAHLLFLLGFSLIPFSLNLQVLKTKITQLTNRYPNIGIHFILIGLIASSISNFVPASLRFVLYLAANLTYVGGILYFFSETQKYRWIVYLFSLVFSFIQASRSSLFHDFLLWGILGASFIFMTFKQTTFRKILVISSGIVIMVLIQMVKSDYRNAIAEKQLSAGERLGLMATFAVESFRGEGLLTPTKLSELNVRLNQGWITSAIMFHVPVAEPFANGQTILLAVRDALVPRILVPDKKKSGGREYFRQYTGIPIDDNTSMGIGLLGEAYLNFSWAAGFFLLFWGLFLTLFLNAILRLAMEKNVLIFFMIPIIFLQVIKAETEFHTVLNHLVKSVFFSVFLYVIWLNRYK